jgi:hypothetical protein
VRDPSTTNSTYQLCQIGLNSTDQDPIKNLISLFMNKMVIQIFGSNSRRKRAADSNITCSKLKQVGSGVTALNETQLADIPLKEFGDCILSLGTVSKWSSDQLSALSNLVFQVFNLIIKIIFIY